VLEVESTVKPSNSYYTAQLRLNHHTTPIQSNQTQCNPTNASRLYARYFGGDLQTISMEVGVCCAVCCAVCSVLCAVLCCVLCRVLVIVVVAMVVLSLCCAALPTRQSTTLPNLPSRIPAAPQPPLPPNPPPNPMTTTRAMVQMPTCTSTDWGMCRSPCLDAIMAPALGSHVCGVGYFVYPDPPSSLPGCGCGCALVGTAGRSMVEDG